MSEIKDLKEALENERTTVAQLQKENKGKLTLN